MEVLPRGRAVRDADVPLGRKLEKALEARARVLWPVSFIPVREEEREARCLSPLRAAGHDELVDDHLRAIHEVAELRLPQDERLRGGDRIAVLETDGGELRERRVVHLERSLGLVQVL